MNGWLIALLLVVAAGVAYATKPREPRRRWPKPGEGMRRRDRLSGRGSGGGELPPELVRVRTVPAEEAHVAAGFLEAHGIAAGLRQRRSGVSAKGPARHYDIYVASDRADEARALLNSVR